MKHFILLLFVYFNVIVGLAQDIQLESFASGFTGPINAAHAGDSRLFVVEKQGVIKILNSDGSINATSFLDMSSIVNDTGGEQGLLGLAFHPNYSSNGFFYVNYINASGDTVISRFTRSTTGIADPNSELVLLTVDQPFANHNAGDMHFGPNDGYLYIATGDGGSGGDPQNKAQDLNSLLGKILRIDVDNTTTNPNLNYAIPTDNPFVGVTGTREEIWSYGLRNPWKFSFDTLNGEMWIADVGQNSIEEINRALNNSTGGENYGWRCYEGNSPFNTSGCGPITDYIFPVAEYAHGGSPFKCSITGGYRYRGSLEPTLQGLYFFADFCGDEIGYVEETSSNTFQLNFTNTFSGQGFSSFAEDNDGELYIIGLNSGEINKITDANLGIDEQNLNTIRMFPNPTSHIINIHLKDIQVKSIRIMDIQGKSIKILSNFSENKIEVSVEDLEKGIYLLEISSDNGQKTVKELLVN